jgi:hypothetical protein
MTKLRPEIGRGKLACAALTKRKRRLRRFGFPARPPYIRHMGERKRKSQRQQRRVATWQISKLRGTPAAFVGLMDAPDAATAKERAIKHFNIRPEGQKRLIAVRHR